MVVSDFYVTGEDFLEHGLDFSVAVGPIRGDEDDECCQQDGDGRGYATVPDCYFAGPEAWIMLRVGRGGWDGPRCGAFHEMVPGNAIFFGANCRLLPVDPVVGGAGLNRSLSGRCNSRTWGCRVLTRC